MKNRELCFLFLLFSLSVQLFARGAQAEEIILNMQNDEWVLCITNFDASALSTQKTNILDIILKNFVERLSSINYRARISPEYAYYEEYAWTRDLSTAAKALSAKQDERSAKIFSGEPDWKYKRDIAKIDSEIEALKIKLEKVESIMPIVNRRPVFKLTDGNMSLSYPSSPEAGKERSFCNAQKADAFLSGSITDFHGRYFLKVKLYTLYTNSFVWEDNVIFSHEEIGSAIEEIALKMIIVLSGNRPSAITVKAEPEDTLVLINKSFAGRGNTDVMEYPPGMVTITASAQNHDSISFETELLPGELSMIDIKLNQVEYGNLDILSGIGGKVYNGALYIGEAPLTLRLPVNLMEFIEIETPGRRGSIVYQSPDMPEYSNTVSIKTSILPKKGHVDRARKLYYWTWGGTWIAGVAAWITYYTFVNMGSALVSDYSVKENYNNDFYSNYQKMYNVYTGALITSGVFLSLSFLQLFFYINTSGKGTTPETVVGRY